MLMKFGIALVSIALASPARSAPVRIGVVNSMTGPESPIGENLTNGIKLALEDLKKKGVDVQVVWEDDTGKPQIGLSALEKLATRENVAGVVGAYTSAVTSAVAKAAERYKVPLVNPVASKEEITRQGYKWVYRVSATTGDYASILLEMALSLGKPKTMAILSENTDFGVSGGKSARAYAEKKGIKVVLEEAYSKGSPDYRSTLLKVKNTNPDLVFMVSYVADAILLMRQSREIGLSPQGFLGAGAGFATVQFAGEKAISNGVFSSSQWTPQVKWPGSKEFNERYIKAVGKSPTYHAATAYAAMMILGEEAAKAGGDREKLRQALETGSWDGVDGPVKFQDYEGYSNQNKHQMLVEQVQDGKHVTVWPTELASGKPIWPFPGWK
ncbi:MAG: branched-chain amino acid ABC transporter substrate-binding protein [Anaeromyxobacter sp. RBG_16_69_14]|nr:MAG: branched-chain amino acid ABC transporter substrate-binding protein [Anaeromyxobacter sp. RBG_16_69_14]HJW75062.1 ABC transporter substrate-binding protein [Thermoleophilia bacterium]